MKTGGGLRHFAMAFLLAILLYVVAFHLIEHRRTQKGPWTVTFSGSPEATPEIVIDQPSLGITNFTVHFETSVTSNVQQTTQFDLARTVPFPVPFGECVFLDSTFLPGTVTLRCFGHEIEMIPRSLIVDHREHPWTTKTLTLGNQSPEK